MRIVKLSKESKENLLADLLKRDPNNYGQYADTVQAIVDDVKRAVMKRCLNIPRSLTRLK